MHVVRLSSWRRWNDAQTENATELSLLHYNMEQITNNKDNETNHLFLSVLCSKSTLELIVSPPPLAYLNGGKELPKWAIFFQARKANLVSRGKAGYIWIIKPMRSGSRRGQYALLQCGDRHFDLLTPRELLYYMHISKAYIAVFNAWHIPAFCVDHDYLRHCLHKR